MMSRTPALRPTPPRALGAPGCTGPASTGSDSSAGRSRPPGRRAVGVDLQRVGQVDRDHLGLEVVVTVGSDGQHPQRQRQLGRGHQLRQTGTGPTSPTPQSRGPRPGPRVPPRRRANAPGSTTPASDRRSILRRWPNPGPHDLKEPFVGHLGRVDTAGAARRSIRTNAEASLGPRHEDGGGHPTHRTASRSPVGNLHRDRTVGRVTGPRGQPLPHLVLDHHQQGAAHHGSLLQHPHDHRGGHVVGEVGHQKRPSGVTAHPAGPPSRG